MGFNTLLIANRGEIACRIIRTARRMGIRTVAVCSEADMQSPHALMADAREIIGAVPVSESYLDISAILEAAERSRADAIHPGYGFLSENAEFAKAVASAGLIFVGPSTKAIASMGNKAEAKRLMIAAGVPCVPGYEGGDQSDHSFVSAAAEIGFPVMIKAAAGGGGRGMRLVTSQEDMVSALSMARNEAMKAFGSNELILEKAVVHARHVEFQIMCDRRGNAIHLGERDCSMQRRHQKIIEEAPCPVMNSDLRQRMGRAALDATRTVDYEGAGTVEFLLDAAGNFYFLEMNTRLQVEHPVTEMVTGLDLVELQLRIARGENLPLTQNEVRFEGHAIEARLCAEDPGAGFLPDSGQIEIWRPPSGKGIRIDAGIAEGGKVSPHYDSMLAKIIAHGADREEALSRLDRALAQTGLIGVKHNAGFLRQVLAEPLFAEGKITTDFLETAWPDGVQMPAIAFEDFALATALIMHQRRQLAMGKAGRVSANLAGWSSGASIEWSLTLENRGNSKTVSVRCNGPSWVISNHEDGKSLAVLIGSLDHGSFMAWLESERVEGYVVFEHTGVKISCAGHSIEFYEPDQAKRSNDSSGTVYAPMHGQIVSIMFAEGDQINIGDTLMVLEAMKMQHRITAPIRGTVQSINATQGSQVSARDVLAELTKSEGT